MPPRSLAGAVAGVLAALALAACGTETIDSEDLESQLADQLTQDSPGAINADDVEVDCPDDIEPEEGRRFDCTMTLPGGQTDLTVNVTLTNDEGGFEASIEQ